MPGFRFSLWHFLIAVAVLCLACAALVGWSPIVASITILVYLLLNCLALTGAIAVTGNARVYWIGLAVFGLGYWWVAGDYFARVPEISNTSSFYYSWPQRTNDVPELATDRLLQLLETTLAHSRLQVGETVMARWNSGSLYPGKITQTGPQGFEIAWSDGSSPSWVAATDLFPGGTSFRTTGHAVCGILIALLGGAISAMAFGAKEEPKVESTSVVP